MTQDSSSATSPAPGTTPSVSWVLWVAIGVVGVALLVELGWIFHVTARADLATTRIEALLR